MLFSRAAHAAPGAKRRARARIARSNLAFSAKLKKLTRRTSPRKAREIFSAMTILLWILARFGEPGVNANKKDLFLQ
jgi:hypothetical protein